MDKIDFINRYMKAGNSEQMEKILNEIGITLYDKNGHYRKTKDVIDELQEKFNQLEGNGMII